MEKNELFKLPPKYNFWLNPYEDSAFTRCPKCEGKTRIQKKVLVILVGEKNASLLNMSIDVIYCHRCELIIADQKCILYNASKILGISVAPDNCNIIGTMELKQWAYFKKFNINGPEVFDFIIPFKKVVEFKI